MAGDWIKMRGDLAEDPAVIGLASTLGMDEDHVVGKLHRLWSWLDRQSRNGHAVGVTEMWLDKFLGVTGFARALSQVGWVVFDSAGMSVPNFDRHNGETAKSRALAGKRKQKQRGENVTPTSRKPRDKSVTREEKRREEVKQEQERVQPTPSATSKTRKPATTPMPDDFAISERVKDWAAKKGFDRLDEHLEAFGVKARARGYTYADWDSAFMGAIRDDWAQLRKAGAGQPPTAGQQSASLPDHDSRGMPWL